MHTKVFNPRMAREQKTTERLRDLLRRDTIVLLTANTGLNKFLNSVVFVEVDEQYLVRSRLLTQSRAQPPFNPV